MYAAGQGWVDALMAGSMNEEAVAAGILSSAEFSALHASNEEFAKALYPALLGREALVRMILADEPEVTGHAVDALFSTSLERDVDPSGMEAWRAALASKATSLEELACELLASEEFALMARG